MSRFVSLVERARAEQQPSLLCDAVPYARFLGLTLSITDAGGLRARMPYAEHLVGNPGVPALHGGVADHKGVIRNVAYDYGTGPYQRPRANGQSGSHYGAGADRRTIAHCDTD